MKMEVDRFVVSFFDLAEEDPRLRSCHLGLYVALLSECIRGGGANPFSFSRQRIMRLAKINSRSTYNQALHDLMNFGFIRYVPAAGNVALGQVLLRKLEH